MLELKMKYLEREREPPIHTYPYVYVWIWGRGGRVCGRGGESKAETNNTSSRDPHGEISAVAWVREESAHGELKLGKISLFHCGPHMYHLHPTAVGHGMEEPE